MEFIYRFSHSNSGLQLLPHPSLATAIAAAKDYAGEPGDAKRGYLAPHFGASVINEPV